MCMMRQTGMHKRLFNLWRGSYTSTLTLKSHRGEDVDFFSSGRNRKRVDVANRAGTTGKTTGGASVSRSSIEIDPRVGIFFAGSLLITGRANFSMHGHVIFGFNVRKKRLYRFINVTTFPINWLPDKNGRTSKYTRYLCI